MLSDGVLFLKSKIATPLVENARSYYCKVTALPGSPRKIARGVSLGLAMDFLPIPIISIPLSYLAARITRSDTVAAVATVVTFKLAVPFFFALNIITGSALLGDTPDLVIPNYDVPLLAPMLNVLAEYGYPFLVGSLVNATLAYLAGYMLLITLLRRKRIL